MTRNAESAASLAPSYDPYDLWMSDFGVKVRKDFYDNKFGGKVSAAFISLVDWLFPILTRKLLGTNRRLYPISAALELLTCDEIVQPEEALARLLSLAVNDEAHPGTSWGLGFPWMSKNGLYDADTPFVTHTPYAMEALLRLREIKSCESRANQAFLDTWDFLESLLILYDVGDQLAVSYAPIAEPRTVINGNSYASFAYALHGRENPPHQAAAVISARRLANFVVKQQKPDGSWYYYADDAPGNFIDCFHSCFVVKNLVKASGLDPQIKKTTANAILLGKHYIDSMFLDSNRFLVRRFTMRDFKDPYIWDLYDQAEYLGLLITFKDYPNAVKLRESIYKNFHHKNNWYCKIDIFGRRWGKNFIRWGIAPFLYQEARLKKELAEIENEPL